MSISSSYVLDTPPSSSSSSFGLDTPSSSSPPSDVAFDETDSGDSLPSSPSSASLDLDLSPSSSEVDEDESDAERQWIESLQQLELLLTMVLVPYVGKYFGRKCAYWGWGKWMEWQYPVRVVVTDKTMFRAAGVVEAVASL